MPAAPVRMGSIASDVIIVGGGLAGLSAAIFLGRAQLRTIVFDKGESTIAPITRVNNYLGFPDGIPGSELLERGRQQAKKFGAEIRAERVQRLRRSDAGPFQVSTEVGHYEAHHILVASNKNTAAAQDLGLTLTGRNNRFIGHDGHGRTSLPHVYVCGRITEHPSQAAISVGSGAEVAITLIQDVRGEYYIDHDD